MAPRRVFTLDEITSAVHVHPYLGILPGKYEGEQTIPAIARKAITLGYTEVVFTPHFSSPDEARVADANDRDRLVRWRNYVSETRRVERLLANTGTPIRLIPGVEANIVGPDGELDLPEAWRAVFDVIIASPQRNMPRDGAAVTRMLHGACAEAGVDILGRPTRYTEGVSGINWGQVATAAVVTGTAIELNWNSWHSYGPDMVARRGGSLKAIAESAAFYERWMREIGRFGGAVFTVFSLDAQNDGMWPTAPDEGATSREEPWMPTTAQVNEFLAFAAECGATDRLVNGGRTRFYPRGRFSAAG